MWSDFEEKNRIFIIPHRISYDWALTSILHNLWVQITELWWRGVFVTAKRPQRRTAANLTTLILQNCFGHNIISCGLSPPRPRNLSPPGHLYLGFAKKDYVFEIDVCSIRWAYDKPSRYRLPVLKKSIDSSSKKSCNKLLYLQYTEDGIETNVGHCQHLL